MYVSGGGGEGWLAFGGSFAIGRDAQGKSIWDGGVAWTPGTDDGFGAQGGWSNTYTFPASGPTPAGDNEGSIGRMAAAARAAASHVTRK